MTPDGTATVLDNGRLRVEVARTGARITDVRDPEGTHWLVRTDRHEPDLEELPPDRIRFTAGTRGGWDECLPSVAATPVTADHGDFWFRPWTRLEAGPTAATWTCAPDGHPLRARKTVRLAPDRAAVRVDVEVHHGGGAPTPVLYSAHPLWRWPATARIGLRDGSDVRGAFGDRWTPDTSGRWPRLGGADLSRVDRTGPPENFKVFVRWGGCATLTFDGLGREVVVRRVGGPLEWLGICVNRDAWPADGPGDPWIALEPTTAPTDSVDDAVRAGTAAVLAAGETLQWSTETEIREVGG
ncbi:hypothetical protein [Nakamurella endophytica]|uniref:Aldose 1-epimerase n=1 Tax=Nakamurella endophytica TaxID=1748367 RepID=A0A917WLZ4_9ACTN|nr:hypothetical protein [Nakamurella endophytica]GGM14677.1 hypothetical protein GCM10011594_38370 [Nakamurella endophytica]